MNVFSDVGHAIVGFFKKVDHALMLAMKFLGAFINGTEIKQAVDFVVQAAEMYVENKAEGITDKIVNPQRREWVVGMLMNLGVSESKARVLTEMAVVLVKNNVHKVITGVEDFINGHIATDEKDAGVSGSTPAPPTS